MTESMRDQATILGKNGFRVFPLKANSKKAALWRWQVRATVDLGQIKQWWTRPDGGSSDSNIGIACGETPDGSYLFVLDIDNKGGKNGSNTLAGLELIYGELPATFTVKTPTGGEHRYFITKKPLGNSVEKLGKGLDTRCVGGYVVAPGSEINGNRYEITCKNRPAPLPEWIEEILAAKQEKAVDTTKPVVELDKPEAIQQATEYLKHAEPALEGSGGDAHTFAVAARVKDFGISQEKCLDLMLDWNERCEPPWEIEELQTKVTNAYRYGKEPPGSKSPEADFAPYWVSEMNRKYQVVNDGGKTLVVRFVHEPTLERVRTDSMSFQSLRELHCNEMIYVGKEEKSKGAAWLTHPNRLTYPNGMALLPKGNTPPGVLNLWQGFGVDAKQGDCSLILTHLKDIICAGNETHFNYLMGWLARMVQEPMLAGEVAIVLKSARGSGKGTTARYIGRMMGQHYLHVSSSNALVGRFNEHLRETIFLFADEAFFAGDKRHESVLKSLVTEDVLFMEGKFKAGVQCKNMLHLWLASNESWVVPAGPSERRFMVLGLDDSKQQDHEYFGALLHEMENDGPAALLHMLLEYDLTGFNVRAIPVTVGLIDQKLQSLKPTEAWWYEMLADGCLPCDDSFDLKPSACQWPEDDCFKTTESLHQSYRHFCKRQNIRYPSSKELFMKELLEMCSMGAPCRPRNPESKERLRGYNLPSLRQCRDDFSKHLGSDVPWDDE